MIKTPVYSLPLEGGGQGGGLLSSGSGREKDPHLNPPPFRGRKKIYLQRACIALVLLFAALWIAGPILSLDSWYRSHDGMRYPYLVYRFQQVINAGLWYPRWIPEMMGGYGYPTFVFYQPGFFYITVPFAYFMNVLAATKLSIFLMLLLGGAGAYQLARRQLPRWVSAVFSVVFLFSPYVATNLLVRGAYGELYAMMLGPWSMVFALRIADKLESRKRIRRPAAGFVAATAGVLLCHPFVAFFFFPFITLFILVRARVNKKWNVEILLTFALLLALAVVLTVPYWFTLLQMKDSVRYQGAVSGFYTPMRYLRPLSSVLFDRDKPTFLYTMLAFAGFAFAWRVPMARLAMGLMLLFIFLTTDYAYFVWEGGYGILKYIQFPWRVQSVNTLVQYMLILQLGVVLAQMKPRHAMAVAALFIAVVFGASMDRFRLMVPVKALAEHAGIDVGAWPILERARPLRAANYFPMMRMKEANQYMTLAHASEFHPKGVRTRGLPNRLVEKTPIAVFLRPGKAKENSIEEERDSTSHYIQLVVTIKEEAAMLINQFYLPGWRIKVDGRTLPWYLEDEEPPVKKSEQRFWAGPGANGRLKIRFNETGTFAVEAWYEGPPYWWLRNIVILLLSALLLYALTRRGLLLKKMGFA